MDAQADLPANGSKWTAALSLMSFSALLSNLVTYCHLLISCVCSGWHQVTEHLLSHLLSHFLWLQCKIPCWDCRATVCSRREGRRKHHQNKEHQKQENLIPWIASIATQVPYISSLSLCSSIKQTASSLNHTCVKLDSYFYFL